MRIVTALFGIPVLVGLTWLGGWPFAAMIAVISVVAQVELYRMREEQLSLWVMIPALLAGASSSMFALGPAFVAGAALLSLVALAAVPARHGVDRALDTAAVVGFGIAYPPLFLGCLTAIRSGIGPAGDAFATTMGIIVLVWAADTGAYYAGRMLGRHLLAPVLSPKKTWEGFAGGVVLAVIASLAWWAAFDTWLAVGHWIVLAVLVAVVGPVGDLFESALKRSAGVKDSATWLPGHGGFLDRFDALAFVGPVALLYLVAMAASVAG